MICKVLTLFKTLVEIIFLQKGPDDIPNSSALFVIVVAIWLLVDAADAVVIEAYRSSALFFIDLILVFAGLGLYAIVVNAFGKRKRLMQFVITILGCSIVFTIVLLGGRLIFPLFLTEDEVSWAVQLIWFWSIPVEGHIIARTIERQWFSGFLIALAVLFVQLQLFAVLKPMLESAT